MCFQDKLQVKPKTRNPNNSRSSISAAFWNIQHENAVVF